MEDSILVTIKKMLGIDAEETAFDTDIIVMINAAFMTLMQLGVGPTTGFRIDDENSIWSDFVDDSSIIGAIKTYIYAKVRVMFDPPSGSTATTYDNIIRELEWRLNVHVDIGATEDEDS